MWDMTDPHVDPLVALWRGVPLGARAAATTTQLAFLANGMGWTEWTTAAGGIEVVGFRWRPTGPCGVEILDIWCAFGLTAERESIEWDDLEWRDDPPFTLDLAVSPQSLVLSGSLGGATEFRLLRREVSYADCRAHGVAPDLGSGIVDEASHLPPEPGRRA